MFIYNNRSHCAFDSSTKDFFVFALLHFACNFSSLFSAIAAARQHPRRLQQPEPEPLHSSSSIHFNFPSSIFTITYFHLILIFPAICFVSVCLLRDYALAMNNGVLAYSAADQPTVTDSVIFRSDFPQQSRQVRATINFPPASK